MQKNGELHLRKGDPTAVNKGRAAVAVAHMREMARGHASRNGNAWRKTAAVEPPLHKLPGPDSPTPHPSVRSPMMRKGGYHPAVPWFVDTPRTRTSGGGSPNWSAEQATAVESLTSGAANGPLEGRASLPFTLGQESESSWSRMAGLLIYIDSCLGHSISLLHRPRLGILVQVLHDIP
ncbi:hypothetical protein S40288_11138 [Stachybotrys chartarum IBT 40288]|nr:hypothetical protein S40288_11138 [Stachybotrys chartarum IBT 40288]